MIRVLLADDHPAVRVGLERLVQSEPGMVHAGSVEDGTAAFEQAGRARADCVVLDYQMPAGGIALCRRLLGLEPPPGLVIYTAFAGERLAVAARVAGVHALVDKSSPADVIFDSIRRAAKRQVTIEPSQAALADIAAELDPDDLPIFGMRIEGTPLGEIGETLRLDAGELEHRLAGLLDRIEARLELTAR
jgi:DNA-binding NarL/FixJ family response regulator